MTNPLSSLLLLFTGLLLLLYLGVAAEDNGNNNNITTTTATNITACTFTYRREASPQAFKKSATLSYFRACNPPNVYTIPDAKNALFAGNAIRTVNLTYRFNKAGETVIPGDYTGLPEELRLYFEKKKEGVGFLKYGDKVDLDFANRKHCAVGDFGDEPLVPFEISCTFDCSFY